MVEMASTEPSSRVLGRRKVKSRDEREVGYKGKVRLLTFVHNGMYFALEGASDA